MSVDSDDQLDADLDDGRSGARHPLVEWIVVVVVAITAALLVRTFVVQQFRVEGESMLSTLHDGDRVLVDKVSYDLHDPRRGDVVVLESTSVPDEDLIKRVVALPGETISIDGCVVTIDGVALDEPYLDPAVQARDGCGDPLSPTVVPSGTVFVLGDHRGRSRDSRSFGPVSFDDIVGRARVIVWPLGDAGGL